MNEYTFQEISIGHTESFSLTVTQTMEDQFREITGDINPLHSDDRFAAEISCGKYESHVTFGMLTASLCSTLAGVYLPGKYSLIHSIENMSFRKPVFAGDTLTVTGVVTDKQDDLHLLRIAVEIANQHGKTVFRANMKVLVQK